MSQKDKRTLIGGAVIVVVYLSFFYGRSLLGLVEGDRQAYFDKLDEAQQLGALFRSYETKIMKVEKYRNQFQLDVHKINTTNLVGNVGRTIQDLVKKSGYKMGQIREVPGSGGKGVAATLQMEGTGPMKSFMPLLYRFRTTGYPLIIDSLNIRSDKKKPGQLEWSVDVIILDYNRWKKEGGNRA
ncbi:hypothetical protein OAM01_01010 [bacterium]|nr:hypothetical protein [bacterium]